MNAIEHFFCSSSLWHYFSQRKLLPWVVSSTQLGDHLLEIGAGYGAATPYLRQRVTRVTSLEYDHRSTRHLKLHHDGGPGSAIRGDASRLPFADHSFSSVLAVLVLHHLTSKEAQDQMFAEVFRVLRPGGVFLAFEIIDSWMNRVTHYRSTFTPVDPASAFNRLASAGFPGVLVDLRGGVFRLNTLRPSQGESSMETPSGPQSRETI